LNKPNGISILQPEDLADKIWPLACRKINGIGPKADAKLQAHGIHTIGELAARDQQWLMDHFGQSYGAWLFAASHGVDDKPVVTVSEPVSMSRETTFEKDLHVRQDKAALGDIFTRLCQQVAADLQRKGYVGKTIGIKLRFDNFQSVTRDSTLDVFTADAKAIRQAAGLCLKRVEFKRRIRLLGVRVGSLVKVDADQALTAPVAKALSSVLTAQEADPLKDQAHEQADLF
jgi:DNA polymerase-4